MLQMDLPGHEPLELDPGIPEVDKITDRNLRKAKIIDNLGIHDRRKGRNSL